MFSDAHGGGGGVGGVGGVLFICSVFMFFVLPSEVVVDVVVY